MIASRVGVGRTQEHGDAWRNWFPRSFVAKADSQSFSRRIRTHSSRSGFEWALTWVSQRANISNARAIRLSSARINPTVAVCSARLRASCSWWCIGMIFSKRQNCTLWAWPCLRCESGDFAPYFLDKNYRFSDPDWNVVSRLTNLVRRWKTVRQKLKRS